MTIAQQGIQYIQGLAKSNAAPPHRQSAYPLLRRLCREVRYREVTELIGTILCLTNPKDAPYDIIEVITPHIKCTPRFHRPELHYRQGAVAKYGLLDLEYRLTPDELTTNYRCGISLLKELGLIAHNDRDELLDEDEKADAFEFFKMSCEELDLQQVFFKLFLTTPKEWEYTIQSNDEEISRTYWPREFTIKDACVTNLPSVWFARHFYM